MTNPEFIIQNRRVGLEFPPLVVAEIGINHGGCLKTAFELVDAAISAGVEVIKHQTHIVEDEMSEAAKAVIPGNADKSIYDIMESCSLNEADELALKNYVESSGAIFISTPFSREAALRLEKMNVPAYKIGSGECNNFPLLELVASFGKPIILSTGMNDIVTINKAVEILRKHQVPFCLLHTTNIYPTPDNLIRIGAMVELQSYFPDVVVGLSDHSIDNLACLGAVAAGASIIERHFTDSKNRRGPDICCSMDTAECQSLINESKRMALMRGGRKQALKEEQVTINFAFASVVTIKNIAKGEEFTKENLWVKRPGTGDFNAESYEKLLGKRAAEDIKADTQILKAHVI